MLYVRDASRQSVFLYGEKRSLGGVVCLPWAFTNPKMCVCVWFWCQFGVERQRYAQSLVNLRNRTVYARARAGLNRPTATDPTPTTSNQLNQKDGIDVASSFLSTALLLEYASGIRPN